MQYSDSFTVEPTLATNTDADGLRTLNAAALALFDKAPFHLCHHVEHGEDDLAHLAARRDMRVKNGHEGPPLLILMDQV